MRARLLTLVALLVLTGLTVSGAAAPGELVPGVPILDRAPSSPAELRAALSAYPELAAFSRDGEVIDTGLQAMVYGEDFPVGPAPATPWAKPLPGGPLKLVMIGQTNNCYDLAEVQRRLDCQVRFVHLPDQYYFAKAYPEALAGYYSTQALKALEPEADVILADSLVRVLSPAVAEAIARKVEAGCGLVINPVARWGGGGQWGYWPAHEQGEPWREFFARVIGSADTRQGGKHNYLDLHSVTSEAGFFDGLPWPLLPAHYLVSMAPAEGATVRAQDGEIPLVIGGPVGRGRVVVPTWGSYTGCFPLQEDNVPAKIDQYQEYYAGAIIRALLWAADRPSPVTLTMPEAPALAAGVPGSAQIKLTGVLPAGAKVELRLRDLLCRDVWTATPTVAGGAVEAKLPALADAQYLLDAIARDGRGNSLGFATFILAPPAPMDLGVSLDREVYQPGQPVTVTAQTGNGPEGNYTATLQIWDALDRLLLEETKPMPAGKAEFTFSNRDPLTVLHYAEVLIKRNGQPYLTQRLDIFVPRYTFTDFRNSLWGSWLPPYAVKRVDRRLREGLGCDVMLCGGYGGSHRFGNYKHLTSGCVPFYTNIAYLSPQAVETAPDKTKADTVAMLEGALPELKQFGGAVLFFQDERHGMSDAGEVTEEAAASFRAWLRGRYPDIQALNAVWGRDYASFDEVQPVLTKEFDYDKEISLAPWLEWRLWVMDKVVDIDRTNVHRIKEYLGHDAWMGLEGIFGLGGHNIPYGGTDLAAQADDCFNAAAPYGEYLMNGCQSFYEGPSFSWNGYGNPYPVYLRYVWARALQGDWSLGWFCGNTFYSATDAFLPQARWVADLTKPLREGVGMLLAEHRPFLREPIAFLYSQPSLYSMKALGQSVDPNNVHMLVRPAEWARDSLQRMFTDAGVQFSYISEKQVQQGQAAGVKLMVLTSCVALEPETCAALERFVAGGGIVLADLAPGVWDDHGAYHSPGQLDALFGVRRDTKPKIATMPLEWGIGIFESEPDFNIKNDWLIGQYFEESLQVSDGRALGKHIFGPVQPPAFVFKRTGRGATILMNYLETEYKRVPEHWQRTVAQEVLRLAQITPQVTLRDVARAKEPIVEGVKIMRWEDGPARYYGVLLDNGRHTEIELPLTGHIYELSSGGRYLGEGATATLDLRDTPHALLAVLPYRIEGLTLSAQTTRLGEGLPLELTMRVSRGQPVRHVVHLDVYQPDGTLNYSLSRNYVFSRGRWSGAIPLALNDPAGQWTIRAREVDSGRTAEVKVQVRK